MVLRVKGVGVGDGRPLILSVDGPAWNSWEKITDWRREIPQIIGVGDAVVLVWAESLDYNGLAGDRWLLDRIRWLPP